MTDVDLSLIKAFENCAIPIEQWTQRTHVSIAFILLTAHPFDEALGRMRKGIRRYNDSNGIVESPTSGYNETTTVAMLRIIAAVMQSYREVLPARNAEEFCDQHPELMSKHVLRLFYSPERRVDPAAKSRFLEPDLTSLPECRDKSESGSQSD